MTSYSRTFYEAYHVETGETVGPEAGYEDAAFDALLEETSRLQEIDDFEFPTSEALAVALDETECAVRFVRAERLTS